MCHPENAEERAARRSGEGDQSDQYVNLFTVGPITEESRKVTGKKTQYPINNLTQTVICNSFKCNIN